MKISLFVALSFFGLCKPSAFAQESMPNTESVKIESTSDDQLALLNPQLAQAQQEKSLQQAGLPNENQSNLQNLLQESTQENSKARALYNKVVSLWNSRGGIFSELSHQLSKAKIKASVTLEHGVVEKIDLDEKFYYQMIIEPAFRNGLQTRRDVWVFEVKTNNGLLLGSQIRITFSQNYKTKSEALAHWPKPFWEIPKNSNDVKTKMSDGEAIRAEILGRIGIGSNTLESKNKVEGLLSLGYNRETLFMIDLERYSPTLTRARILGLKNKGQFDIGVNVHSIYSPVNWLAKIFKGPLKEFFTFDIGLNFSKSFNPLDKYPIDTMMIDFAYYFHDKKEIPSNSKDDKYESYAESALDQLLEQSRKFGFVKLFLPMQEADSLKSDLLNRVSKSIAISKEDLPVIIRGETPRVATLFKGRMNSSLVKTNPHIQISSAFKTESQNGGISSAVETYDINNKVNYYILENMFSQYNESKIASLFDKSEITNIDILLFSDKKGTIKNLSDLVIQSQNQYKSASASDIEKVKESFLNRAPEALTDGQNINDFFPHDNQTNVAMSYRLNFSPIAFRSLSGLSAADLFPKIDAFFQNHSNKYLLRLPGVISDSGPNYSEYVDGISIQLKKLINMKLSHETRHDAFAELSKDPNFFNYIIGEFIPRLVSKDLAKKDMSYQLDFSSNETERKILSAGHFKSSQVYNAVSFFRNLINNRSFDLPVQSDLDPQSLELKNFKIYLLHFKPDNEN